jgi:lactate racemase
MTLTLGYGKKDLSVDLSGFEFAQVVRPRSETNLVERALAAPIGTARLSRMVKPGQKIVIITSDITRPCPSAEMLPWVVTELEAGGVKDEDVTIIFALGTHRSQTEAEQRQLVGDAIFDRFTCIDSDPNDVVRVGVTRRGTPVEVFKTVLDADFRITLANVEPHYFAGYSGGAKSILPGVCSKATIRNNHAMMVEEGACAGVLEGNPVRADIEEGAAMVGIDFILNVVVGHHTIIEAVAGHVVDAHRYACRLMDYHRSQEIESAADVVLVGSGGHPKDLNLYQAQKALDNAGTIVKPGGIIIWLAECLDGFGSDLFKQWMLEKSTDQMLVDIQADFVLGGHKAAAIAMVQKKAQVYFVSKLDPAVVRKMSMTPFDNLDKALAAARQQAGEGCRLIVLPEGSAVMPAMRG